MTNRFENTFARLAAAREGAFVPFLTLCDPDADTTLAAMEALIEGGADALELGIPFSDPVADGPVIEASAHRALAGGATPAKCLDVVARFRARHPDVPVSLMADVNLVAVPGAEAFMKAAVAAGADALLIPNLPASMRKAETDWDETARRVGLHMVALVPPAATDEAVQTLAGLTGGYTYLLSRAGITGTDVAAPRPAEHLLDALKAAGAPSPLLGFGVSKPEHVRAALSAGAAGVIVGSAVVAILTQHLGDREGMCKALTAYAAEMKAACK